MFITRHGQTQDNVKGITMGQGDSALTALGIRQAQQKALELKKIPTVINRIYTSDLGRCTQTAQIISDSLDLREVNPHKGLREISFGEYEGLPYDSIPQIEGGYMKARFPGGESNEIMAERVIDAANNIYKSNKEACILVVSHSGPIAVILASYYGKNLESALNDKINNEEITYLRIDDYLTYPKLFKR